MLPAESSWPTSPPVVIDPDPDNRLTISWSQSHGRLAAANRSSGPGLDRGGPRSLLALQRRT